MHLFSRLPQQLSFPYGPVKPRIRWDPRRGGGRRHQSPACCGGAWVVGNVEPPSIQRSRNIPKTER